MKEFKSTHSWDVTPKQAIEIQKKLALGIKSTKPKQVIRYIAGLDCAFDKAKSLGYAALVLWDIQKKCVIAKHGIHQTVKFPYIPGLLSFREAPLLLAALNKLSQLPDALIIDGQGIAHPRRVGIATHMGIITGIPTIGCAKSRLVGEYQEPAQACGSYSHLYDKDDIIGRVLRTRARVKPLFISIGSHIDINSAQKLILQCSIGYRLPEPTRLADKYVATLKM